MTGVLAAADEQGGAHRWVLDRTGSETWADVADWLVDRPLQILIVWIVAVVLVRVVRRLIRHFVRGLADAAESKAVRQMRGRAPSVLVPAEPSARAAARAETVTGVLRSTTSAVVYTFAAIYTLDVLGMNLGPLIAGAGLVGIALGFGAQSLVRDLLAGLFILVEDQYGVGDVVDLGEATGTVEAVRLRTTRLRDVDGTVWHVPNGEVRRVGNQSQQWARAVLDIEIAHGSDVDRAIEVLKQATDAVVDDDEGLATDVLERPEVWGVQAVTREGITLRLVVKTRPGSQWKVMRAVRLRLVGALAAAGIRVPGAATAAPPPDPER
ncbi:MAG: mechanosensitive ion channel family protein [Acidimicrobiales bacterium]|nr:mechanosensitive ion channel family protein [Acidimicrobiales bacterium]